MIHQPIQTSVTRLGPLRNPSGEVATRPKIVEADEAASIKELHDDLRRVLGQFARIFEIFRGDLMIVDGGMCDIALFGRYMSVGFAELLMGLQALLEKAINLPSNGLDLFGG